jgi:ABC-type proline/glycine betaine transport system permease subunit
MRSLILFLFSPFKFLHLLTLKFILESFSAQLSGATRWRYRIQPDIRFVLNLLVFHLMTLSDLTGVFAPYLSLVVSFGLGYSRTRCKINGKITHPHLDKLKSIPAFSFLTAVTQVFNLNKKIADEPAPISRLFTAPIWV